MSHIKSVIKLAHKIERKFKLSLASNFPEFKNFDISSDASIKATLNQASIKMVDKIAHDFVGDYRSLGLKGEEMMEAISKFDAPVRAESFFKLVGLTTEELEEVRKYKKLDAWYATARGELNYFIKQKIYEIIESV